MPLLCVRWRILDYTAGYHGTYSTLVVTCGLLCSCDCRVPVQAEGPHTGEHSEAYQYADRKHWNRRIGASHTHICHPGYEQTPTH